MSNTRRLISLHVFQDTDHPGEVRWLVNRSTSALLGAAIGGTLGRGSLEMTTEGGDARWIAETLLNVVLVEYRRQLINADIEDHP